MIDLHAHASSPSAAALAARMPDYAEQARAMAARYRDPRTAAHMARVQPEWEHRLTDLDTRLAHMDAAGVDLQVVSVNPGQYYHWANPDDAMALTTAINADLAALVERRPDRFLAFGTVALQHPALAAEQLADVMDRRGFVGVQISTQAGGTDLSDPAYEVLWNAAEQHGAVVFLHPLGCPQMTERLTPAYLNNIVGQPLETAVALSLLIFTGVLDRHPELRLCVAHGGGYLPAYLGRSEHAYRVRPDSRTMEHPPGHYLRRMWFDSVVHSPGVARALVGAVGSDRVVIGTDYPFDMGDADPAALVDAVAGLTDEARASIHRGNAERLLSLTPPDRTVL
ncbi:amidohydrolase family protein [Actinomadura madurae]|uniref:amidohydrolase family protein n=1 Tax=Actinomadura madurae TaxID=1993 RepID=UPI0020D20246|nr:amidohydrolase family protein [Actinomadura madurae]